MVLLFNYIIGDIMSDPKKTTFTVSEEDGQIFRLLKARTGYNLDEIFHMLAKEVKTIMCEGIDPKASRLNFMIDADLKNTMVHLRFSPLYFGLDNLTKEQHDEVLRAFDYSTDGKFTDLRGKQKPQPPEEKKESA